jgi:hypothetical protein
MTHFERRLRKTEEMSDAHSDYYDCAACLWPGVMVEKGDEEHHGGSLMPMIAKIIPRSRNKIATRN